jgi:hypothetical protein
MSLFSDDIIVYISDPKNSSRKFLYMINSFSEVAGYKIKTKKSVAFFYTKDKQDLLGIYPEDVPTSKKDTCSTMFIAALFIIARSWKEPRCPSTEEWIQKMWYIYTMEYYSAIKKNEFVKFLGKWMDLEGIILSAVTQSQKN